MATIPLQTKTNSFLKIEDDSIAEILVIVSFMDVLCNWIFQLLERQWDISIQNILQMAQKKKKALEGLGRGSMAPRQNWFSGWSPGHQSFSPASG